MLRRGSFFSLLVFFILIYSCSADFKRLESTQIQLGDMVIDKESLAEPDRLEVSLLNGNLKNLQETLGATHYFLGNLWTDGIIPIKFQEGLSRFDKNYIFRICAEWGKTAKISCKPWEGETQHVLVETESEGCFAEIGMGYWYSPGGRERTLNLDEGCWYTPVILHEFGHVLGLLHEHQRDDRNNYIQIFWSNINIGALLNFIRLVWSTQHTDYDFDSIMHYARYFFSSDRKIETMAPLPEYEKYHYTMGEHIGLSAGDRLAAEKLYGKR